ncbi:UvrABC system protein C [Streptomyces californicus]
MAGRTGTYIRRLEKDMAQAAEEMEYERAARLRDDAGALKRAMEKSAVVLADATDADLIAVAEDELEAALQIFHVRGGRVRGQRGWVTDKVEAVDTSGLVEHALQQLYGEERGDAVPKEVLVPALPEDPDAVSQWLTDRRGSQVSLRIPQRGDKKDLMATVQHNAQQALGLHKTKRASDLTTLLPRPGGDRRGAGPGRRAAARRVLRRLPSPGRRRGGLHGGVRGRAGPQERQ